MKEPQSILKWTEIMEDYRRKLNRSGFELGQEVKRII
jgi:hypothetical protein